MTKLEVGEHGNIFFAPVAKVREVSHIEVGEHKNPLSLDYTRFPLFEAQKEGSYFSSTTLLKGIFRDNFLDVNVSSPHPMLGEPQKDKIPVSKKETKVGAGHQGEISIFSTPTLHPVDENNRGHRPRFMDTQRQPFSSTPPLPHGETEFRCHEGEEVSPSHISTTTQTGDSFENIGPENDFAQFISGDSHANSDHRYGFCPGVSKDSIISPRTSLHSSLGSRSQDVSSYSYSISTMSSESEYASESGSENGYSGRESSREAPSIKYVGPCEVEFHGWGPLHNTLSSKRTKINPLKDPRGGHDDLARRGIATRTAPTTRANGKGFSPHPRPCGIPRAFDGGRAKIGETRDTP